MRERGGCKGQFGREWEGAEVVRGTVTDQSDLIPVRPHPSPTSQADWAAGEAAGTTYRDRGENATKAAIISTVIDFLAASGGCPSTCVQVEGGALALSPTPDEVVAGVLDSFNQIIEATHGVDDISVKVRWA